MKIILKYFRDIIKGGTDLLFPPLCFNCNEKMNDDEKVICNSCWLQIPLLPNNILSKKNKGKFLDILDGLWLFDDNFKNIVHFLKYSNCQSVGIEIGRRMGLYLLDKNSIDFEQSILVPVPLHLIKKRERGYNQSELIAKGISQITGIKMRTDLIRRIKNTSTQTKMNRKERIINMKNAFRLNKEISNKTIILIDDVFTTGTTMNSVAEILKSKDNIYVFAFCAAMPE